MPTLVLRCLPLQADADLKADGVKGIGRHTDDLPAKGTNPDSTGSLLGYKDDDMLF
jgi:hypothetical protein